MRRSVCTSSISSVKGGGAPAACAGGTRGRGIGSKMTDGSGADCAGLERVGSGGLSPPRGTPAMVGERGRGGVARTGLAAAAGVSRGVMLRLGSCSASREDGPGPGGGLREKSVITAPAEGEVTLPHRPCRGVNFGS
ncbi:hypothetical protein KH5H1_31530 [Corallococcus caeni]|nr:hypothetical protein KH5H1_31530 [Corallococcus sp. KH5-1]